MRKLILFFPLFLFSTFIFSQNYDTKYTLEYALKKADGTLISTMSFARDGDKMKFTKVNNRGLDNESKIEIYIFKDEGKVYTVNSGRGYQTGSRHALDLSFVGMQTGVYILDLGNDGTLFNSSYVTGTGSFLGNECTIYTFVTQGDAKSEYYMYQNNLMLKRWVGSPTEGNSLEATAFNKNADSPLGTFQLPRDVQFPDY